MKPVQRVFVDGTSFLDAEGRTLLFRGCNLGGDSKVPVSGTRPDTISFVGRPFPEAEADAHFARLAGWGFNLVRLVMTWEAVEHAGPGVYDEEYLSYLRNVIKSADAHGISVFVDPHQDTWSRATGGSGAPAWTLEAMGFDLSLLEATGAVDRSGPWPLNYHRYACATLFTLFFGGNTFAPGRYVEGMTAQDWLQDHFIDAMRHTARRLKDCDGLIGFGTFNEPHPGFIGLPTLGTRARMMAAEGVVPTPFEAIAAASGFPVEASRFALFGHREVRGAETLNGIGKSLFREGFVCPWREAGAWTEREGQAVAVNDAFFARGEFARDYLKPFQARFMDTVSKKHEHYVFFAEGVPLAERASWPAEDRVRSDGKPLQVAEAFHWYEGFLVTGKKWRPWLAADALNNRAVLGRGPVRKSVGEQFSSLASKPRAEDIPALVGEFGVPFDLARGRAGGESGWHDQEEAFALYYDAIDSSMLHSLVWNYAASNGPGRGDGWNGEDFSIWSESTGGGRALKGFSRPWPVAVSGTPDSFSFNAKNGEFNLEWQGTPGVTEIFVPAHWYPGGWRAEVTPAKIGIATYEEDPDRQRLFVTAVEACALRARILPL